MSTDYLQRIRRLTESLSAHGLDGVILLPGPNLRFCTGLSFHLMGRPTLAFLTVDRPPWLLVPELERSKAEGNAVGAKVITYGEDVASRQTAFADAAATLGLARRRMGVEPLRMRWLEERLLEEAAPGVRLEGAEAVLEPMRAEKAADEIAAIERAVGVAQTALELTLPAIRLGMSERELASELTLQLLRAGSETELPFSPIVASGPKTALPHAVPTARPLQSGDLLILDWGATVGGYISDLTRTFALESLEAEWKRIHAVVVDANAAGRAAAGPGGACRTVDAGARGGRGGGGGGCLPHGRRGRARRDRGGRLRTGLHPPHRPRHWTRGPRSPVHP